MKRIVQQTSDGSQTIAIPEMHVTYHSIHGAVQESMHVFINAGLLHVVDQYETINIFEMGFGTGLNALLTLDAAIQFGKKINYHTVEQFPLSEAEYLQLNYENYLQQKDVHAHLFQMRNCEWNSIIHIHPQFSFNKQQQSLLDFTTQEKFNLIYYDAFAPTAQPELWTKEIFEKMFNMLEENGILVTYCSKGDVRRAMLAAGFVVEKLQGPPRKREMLRAIKKS